jgi:hypothetical protein
MLGKILKDNLIFGYLVYDNETNKNFIVLRKDIGNYTFSNVKISKDNKVHGSSIRTYSYEEVFPNESNLVLYHGSKSRIQGKISYNLTSNLCDFGIGFYLGNNLNQAINRVSNSNLGVVYSFNVNLAGLKVYKFDNDLEWALFVGINRGKISVDSYKKLRLIYNKINSYDVIIGYIADDKIAEAYNDFLKGNITDKCLSECLKLITYGNQYVFKTEKACNALKLANKHKLTIEERKSSINWGRLMKKNMNSDLELLKVKYRRLGNYIDEVLNQYK